jgi:DNA helicase-2/ATP-dependent DNA helicase PcrA
MDFLDNLNDEQREAVLQTGGPLLILAGAGSGKTRVIAFRIAYLIGAGHADPHEILAVTFTNKAADEMRTRVETLVGPAASGAWISTFHSMCARLLRREAPAIGLSRDFVIYDASDQLTAMKRVLRDLRIDDGVLQPRAALTRISQAKNRMDDVAAHAVAGFNPREEMFGKVYAAYQRALADANALDFDDLLLKTVDLFETAVAVRDRYSRRFRFIMVDEYQDTNRPQYLLIRRLADAHRNLCVVGDPDQSIYKWRGADLRNIMDFERDFPETRVVKLERNYRSTQVILDAASAVIRQNRNRKEKRLWTERTGGERIVYFRAGDELEEADFVARTAREALAGDVDASVAILYRTNAQSRVIEDAFRRAGVAYKIVGGVRFYERKEVKDALAYLRLLINPDDDVSLRRVINVPARGIGKAVIEAVEGVPLLIAAAEAREARGAGSLWARLVAGLKAGVFAPRAAASLRAFRELVESLAETARREPVSAALAKVLDRSGYLQDLREERSEDAEGRIENLAELVSAAREFETREPEPSLSGFVDRLSLLSDVDEEEGASDARVLMMTLHSAKGLEFPAVIITGLEEGLFPHSRSVDEEAELEEERRLCYVGMTRAESSLVLSGAARRRVFGEYRQTEPSRFIDEVPDDLLVRLETQASALFQGRFNTYGGRTGAHHGAGSARPRARRQPWSDEVHEPSYSYESEDQSATRLRPGMKVRHPHFGLGTVLSVEQLDDDVKLTVRFVTVGSKRLLARFAKLEPA